MFNQQYDEWGDIGTTCSHLGEARGTGAIETRGLLERRSFVQFLEHKVDSTDNKTFLCHEPL